MSKRMDITDGMFATTKNYGLVYTEELGWIDLGHAQGNDARVFWNKNILLNTMKNSMTGTSQ